MKTFRELREAAIHRTYKAIPVEKGLRKNDDLEKKKRTPHSAKDIETKYEVNFQGEKVGTLKHGSYHGDIQGSLHGKQLPKIEKYAPYTSNPVTKLHAFLRTNKGRKWAKDLSKNDTDK